MNRLGRIGALETRVANIEARLAQIEAALATMPEFMAGTIQRQNELNELLGLVRSQVTVMAEAIGVQPAGDTKVAKLATFDPGRPSLRVVEPATPASETTEALSRMPDGAA